MPWMPSYFSETRHSVGSAWFENVFIAIKYIIPNRYEHNKNMTQNQIILDQNVRRHQPAVWRPSRANNTGNSSCRPGRVSTAGPAPHPLKQNKPISPMLLDHIRHGRHQYGAGKATPPHLLLFQRKPANSPKVLCLQTTSSHRGEACGSSSRGCPLYGFDQPDLRSHAKYQFGFDFVIEALVHGI